MLNEILYVRHQAGEILVTHYLLVLQIVPGEVKETFSGFLLVLIQV